jgi:hypothetical protein
MQNAVPRKTNIPAQMNRMAGPRNEVRRSELVAIELVRMPRIYGGESSS